MGQLAWDRRILTIGRVTREQPPTLPLGDRVNLADSCLWWRSGGILHRSRRTERPWRTKQRRHSMRAW